MQIVREIIRIILIILSFYHIILKYFVREQRFASNAEKLEKNKRLIDEYLDSSEMHEECIEHNKLYEKICKELYLDKGYSFEYYLPEKAYKLNDTSPKRNKLFIEFRKQAIKALSAFYINLLMNKDAVVPSTEMTLGKNRTLENSNDSSNTLDSSIKETIEKSITLLTIQLKYSEGLRNFAIKFFLNGILSVIIIGIIAIILGTGL